MAAIDPPTRPKFFVYSDGEISTFRLTAERDVVLAEPATSVYFAQRAPTTEWIALAIFKGSYGDTNLVVFDESGRELVRLGSSCGDGYVDHLTSVFDEIRVIEVTRDGLFQARFDLQTFELERVGEWR